MTGRTRNALLGLVTFASFAAAVVIVTLLYPAHPARSQSAPAGKTAGEVFKNVQVLKNIPANQLIPSMRFIASSLGVHCEFCHVEGAFYKDTKRPKITARHMIAMELAINKQNFGGRTEVTCYTCHRGMTHPVGVPVLSEEAASRSAEGANHTPPPSADEILAKFAEASGGASAVGKISSRVLTGTVLDPQGHTAPVEIADKAPDQRRISAHLAHGEMLRVYDGSAGWSQNPGRPAAALSGADLAAAKLNADLHLAVNLHQKFSHLHPIRPEMIGGHEAYGLIGFNPGEPPVRFYFDSQSGLLARMITVTPTPLGDIPLQVDYADYRKTGGVAVPYHQAFVTPEGAFAITIDHVRQNAPVSESEFAKPGSK